MDLKEKFEDFLEWLKSEYPWILVVSSVLSYGGANLLNPIAKFLISAIVFFGAIWVILKVMQPVLVDIVAQLSGWTMLPAWMTFTKGSPLAQRAGLLLAGCFWGLLAYAILD